MKAFLCSCSGHAWSGVSGQPSPLAAEGLQPHLSCSATTPSQLTLAKCRTPMLPSHCFLTSSSSRALLSLTQAALAPPTVHTERYTERQHLSPHLLSALKYVCKVSVCAVHAYSAKTCPSRPTQAPTMAAMTNHLSASLFPSPGGCCCLYGLKC